MRRILGMLVLLTLVLTALLSGCGTDEYPASEAKDTAPTSDEVETPAEPPTEGPVEFTEVAILSETAGGGEKAEGVAVLDSDAAVTEFTAYFTSERLVLDIERAVAGADVPAGHTVVGAVIALGCDTPTEVFVNRTAKGLEIKAGKVPSPLPECFAPVTTVALVTVPDAVV